MPALSGPLRPLSGRRRCAEPRHRDGAARDRHDGTEDQNNDKHGQDQHNDDTVVAGGRPVRRWSPRPLLRPWCRSALATPVALHARWVANPGYSLRQRRVRLWGVPDVGDDKSQPPQSPPASRAIEPSAALGSARHLRHGWPRPPPVVTQCGSATAPSLALHHHGGCERIGDAMNAGLSVLIPLLIMFFALSLERVESRLCARPQSEQPEELLTNRVHPRRLQGRHDSTGSRPRNAASDRPLPRGRHHLIGPFAALSHLVNRAFTRCPAPRAARAGDDLSRSTVIDVGPLGQHAQRGETMALGGDVLLIRGNGGVADRQSAPAAPPAALPSSRSTWPGPRSRASRRDPVGSPHHRRPWLR